MSTLPSNQYPFTNRAFTGESFSAAHEQFTDVGDNEWSPDSKSAIRNRKPETGTSLIIHSLGRNSSSSAICIADRTAFL
jgi:hypothetical protein